MTRSNDFQGFIKLRISPRFSYWQTYTTVLNKDFQTEYIPETSECSSSKSLVSVRTVICIIRNLHSLIQRADTYFLQKE